MSVDCAHLEQDWELFVLGSLDQAAHQMMASHLQSGCRECQHKFMEAQATVVSIAAAAPELQPSARVERALMKRIRAHEQSVPAWTWPRWNWAPWAVATACLVLAGWFFWQQRRLSAELTFANVTIRALRQTGSSIAFPTVPPIAERPALVPAPLPSASSPNVREADNLRIAELESEIAELRKQNDAISAASAAAEQRAADLQSSLNVVLSRTEALTRDLDATGKLSSVGNQSEIADLKRHLSESRVEIESLNQLRVRNAQIESLLQSGSTRQIELRPVDRGAGRSFARVLYSPQGGLLLLASALPKLDHEKCYQLWVIRKGVPAIRSAGLLQTSEDGRAFLFVQPTTDLAQVTGLAITDEPKGGSVSARGHKLLFGAR